ncbi:MAG: hypothetical protein CMK59_01275 [Proteobacteria bacterium]|nr:hypothetical protein [Pseudomonadota bacterium]
MPCAQYSDIAEAYGYCVYKHSGGFRTIDEIELFCSAAGSWEPECRHAWVSGRMQKQDFSTQELIKACGSNPDCTFELIDFRPDPDILVQADLCTRHVRKHIRDCVGHAVQRWWMQEPDEEEIARVLAQPTSVPDKFAYYIAALIQCDGVGSCSGEPYVTRLCLKNVKAFKKDPQSCPKREEKKLHNMKPSDMIPESLSGQKFTPKPPPKPKVQGVPHFRKNKNNGNSPQHSPAP